MTAPPCAARTDAPGSGPEEKLPAVFDWLAVGHTKPGFRGCPFTNAAVETADPDHPVRAVILAYKNWLISGDHDVMRRAGRAAARLIVTARTPSGPAACTPGTMVPEDDENTEH
ncbi:hypothetical protein ACQEV4_24100 [Streptomyces shenzhenensis]|uniref:hypothetical protein n=1 Tax=Streptomyces shenzhenensis TaxID=943815 RepID=UPI003D911F22